MRGNITTPIATVSPAEMAALFVRAKFRDLTLGTATCFTIQSEEQVYVVTNRHVVTGRDNVTNEVLNEHGAVPEALEVLFHVDVEPNSPWIFKRIELYYDNEPTWFEHPALRRRADLVAIPIEHDPIIRLVPLSLDQPELYGSLHPTDIVSVIGYPFGKAIENTWPIFSTGFVASNPALDFEGLPVFLIDCRARKGQSGSPVMPNTLSVAEDGTSPPALRGNRWIRVRKEST